MSKRTVVGVFRSRDRAERAVRELRDRGFQDNEISIVARDEGRGQQGDATTMGTLTQDLGEGVSAGGAIGGLAGLLAGAGALAIPGLGPIIAAGPIAGALSGAATGGIAGGLLDFGIPEERGRQFENEVRQGAILALVETGEQKAGEAMRIMKDNGAEEVEARRSRRS